MSVIVRVTDVVVFMVPVNTETLELDRYWDYKVTLKIMKVQLSYKYIDFMMIWRQKVIRSDDDIQQHELTHDSP